MSASPKLYRVTLATRELTLIANSDDEAERLTKQRFGDKIAIVSPITETQEAELIAALVKLACHAPAH